MKKLLPIIAALSVIAVYATAQTTYLGNILQMHRQVEPLPAPTNYEGAIVYNRDAGALYFSNGTIWAPIAGDAGGSSSGTAVGWADAGTGGLYNTPVSQVRVGNIDSYSPDGGAVPPAFIPHDALKQSTLWVYSDGGSALGIYTTRLQAVTGAASIAPTNSTNARGPSMVISSDRLSDDDNFVQVMMTARGTNGYWSAITHVDAASDFAQYRRGLNLNTGGPGISLDMAGASFPYFYLSNSNGSAIGGDQGNANATLTVSNGSGLTGIRISSLNVPSKAWDMNNNGPDFDLGNGTNDYLESNGTRIVTPGGVNLADVRVTGNTSSSSGMLDNGTVGTGVIGFRQSDNQHYKVTSSQNYAPILSGADWVYDGRTFEVEVTHELTSCPVARKTASILGAGGGDITVFCNDAASATVSVGSGHPAQPYRNFVTPAATCTGSNCRSIFATIATSAPASNTAATPQVLTSRQAGPVFAFRLRTGSANWASNITWYAGLVSSIPAAGSPLGSSVYLRFDTNNPLPSSTADTRFRLCACNSGTCTCSNLSTAPATSTEYLFEVDCRESSSACYAYMNGVYETSVSTNLPGLSTPMGFTFALENVDSNARTAGLGRLRIRQE